MSQSRDLPLPQDKTGGVAGNGGKSTSGTNAEGILECYGHKILRGDDPKCAQCEWLTSCTYYTSENLGSRSREIHYRDYMAIPFDKVGGLEIEKAMEDALLNRKDVFRTSDGKEFDLSGINVELVKITIWLALEFPETMQALALKLDPRIKSLDDMAAVLGTSRQLLHRHIARECGVGSKPQRRKNGKSLIGIRNSEEENHDGNADAGGNAEGPDGERVHRA